MSSHARRGCACARRPIFCSPMPNGGIHEAGEEAEQKRYEVAQDHARMEFYSPWEAIESRGLEPRLRHMKRASRCAQGMDGRDGGHFADEALNATQRNTPFRRRAPKGSDPWLRRGVSGSRGPATDYIDIGEKRGLRGRRSSTVLCVRHETRWMRGEKKKKALGFCEARLDTSQSAFVWL